MWKITSSLTKLENKIKTRKARKLALKNAETEYKNLVKAIKKSQNPADFLNADDIPTKQTPTEKIKEGTKTKTEQDVFRYFLQDDTKKGVCSAQIKKICGNKAIWKTSKTGKKNQYVAGIENMPSNEVDKVMTQFKNMSQYFVKSPYKAKIWSSQK